MYSGGDCYTLCGSVRCLGYKAPKNPKTSIFPQTHTHFSLWRKGNFYRLVFFFNLFSGTKSANKTTVIFCSHFGGSMRSGTVYRCAPNQMATNREIKITDGFPSQTTQHIERITAAHTLPNLTRALTSIQSIAGRNMCLFPGACSSWYDCGNGSASFSTLASRVVETLITVDVRPNVTQASLLPASRLASLRPGSLSLYPIPIASRSTERSFVVGPFVLRKGKSAIQTGCCRSRSSLQARELKKQGGDSVLPPHHCCFFCLRSYMRDWKCRDVRVLLSVNERNTRPLRVLLLAFIRSGGLLRGG